MAARSKKPAQPAASATPPAGASPQAAPAVTASDAASLPPPKAGLWETSTTTASGVHRYRHCGGAKPLAARDLNREAESCSRFDIKRGLTGGFTFDAVCGRNGYSGTTHAIVTGDFDSTYVWDVATTVNLPGRAPMVIKSHSEARYLGPCPAGMTPEG